MSTSKPLGLLIFITLVSPSLTNGFGLHLIKVPDEDRSQVMCTIALLSKYFRSGEPLSGSLLSMSITSASVHIQQSLLDAIHSDISYSWSVVVKDARHETPITSPMLVLHEKPQCYFVVIENLEDEDLEDIFEDWRATINWNPLAQFVVYLASVEETDEEMTELMIEILLSFMNIKIYNVNVIGQNEENGFFYGKTVFPYHPDNNCGNRVIAIETLDICDYQGTERDDEEAEVSYEYDEEEEQGADDNEEGENNDEEGEDDNEENGDDKGENGNDNEEGEGDNEGNTDDNKEENGNDNEKGEDDNEENTDDIEEDGNDNEDGADENKDGEDDKQEGGNDNEEGEGDNEENADDNEEGGNDNEEGVDDNEENTDGNEEDETDNKEGAGEKEEGEGDNGEGADDNEEGENNNEEGVDDNEEGIDEKKEVEDDNQEGGINNGAAEDDKEENPDDNGEGGNDIEESEDEKKGGVDSIEEGADEKKEGENDNEEGADGSEDGADGNKNVTGDNNEDVAEQNDSEDKEKALNKAAEADNKHDNRSENGHDLENPNDNEDGLKSQENENTGGEETEHSIENNSNQEGQPVESEEDTKTTSEINVDYNNNNQNDYSSSNGNGDNEIQSEQSYGYANKRNKNYQFITKKKNYRNKNKRIKRQMTADEEEHNVTEPSGKIYLEELYRALFLDKFPKDLSGCPLVAAYRPWEPYIFNEDNTKNDKNYEDAEYTEVSNKDDEYGGSVADTEDTVLGSKLSGIEYKMVQTIAERLHISIDIQVENQNLFHLFQQLIDGDIEMVVGGVDEDPSISQYVSSTIPYHQDDLTWCVAKAKRTYNMFNFLASFRMSIWALIFTFVLITALTIIFIQKTLKVKIPYLQGYFTVTTRIYGVIFSQTIQLKRIPSALKICLGTAFFMSLMFSNVYHSFLISTLTTPKSSYQISHLDEIYSHRMSIMGSVENVRHLNKDGQIFKYIREKFQMCYNIEECLIRAANDDRIAVAVSRQHSFYNPRIPRDQLYCFDRDENIYVYMVTLLLPKKFHLLHKINPIIQHVIESGHMQKWARDLDMKRKIKEEVNRVREDPVKKLTLSDVGGSILFTAILLMFAFLVFIVECWVHWMVTKRKTRLKLVKKLHKKFK